MKNTLNKIIKITDIAVYAIWTMWTIFACVSYAVSWVTSPSYAHLRMGETMSYANFVINGVFIITLMTDVIYNKINKKAKTSD